MHEYTVELRINGPDLNPDEVTTALKLEPSSVRVAGEYKTEKQQWKESLWGYNGFHPDIQQSWSSLEEGCAFLLDRLEPLRAQIHEYQKDHDVVFWCAHFQSSFDGGPTLSAKLMRRLGDFGIDVFIDNYPRNA